MHSIALPINEIKLKITLSYGAYKNVTFFYFKHNFKNLS